LEYILGDKALPEPEEPLEWLPGADPNCFLCQCVAAKDDCRRLVISRRRHAFTVLNRYPYNNGHLLIGSCRHCARLDELDAEAHLELMETLVRMMRLLEKVLHPEGFNVGLNVGRAAGAGVPDHIHWHLVPRWTGDTNFMPATAAANVIPQSLEALWKALTAELAKQ
jgi:ATP adenylyltransferase